MPDVTGWHTFQQVPLQSNQNISLKVLGILKIFYSKYEEIVCVVFRQQGIM